MKVVIKYTHLTLLSALLLMLAPMSKAGGLTVAIANSTCEVMKKVGVIYQQQQGINVEFICKSSGRLAKGIVGGAITADIFISANKKWMDYMTEKGAVNAETVTSPWGNSLVVAVRGNSTLELVKWSDLESPNIKTVMIGDPGTAPFGRYAKQAMEITGIWKNIRQKIQTKKHITLLAETLAVSDESTVGILYATNVSDDLRVIYTIDESWHKPVRYYMAATRQAINKTQVDSLLSFLRSPQVDELMQASGFVVIN